MPGMLHCLETLGKVAASQGTAERAARLWGAAAALREGAGAPLPPVERADHERSVAAARATVGRSGSPRPGPRGGTCPSRRLLQMPFETLPNRPYRA